jgi:signal transduction histidine kinase
MFQGLKIAVRRQKKLLLIFVITIFLPSATLSIFGIIALRNQKFRISQEIENEQLQIANSVKDHIVSRLTDTRERIENLAGYPAIRQKDYRIIRELITELSHKDSLAGITFLFYKNEEPVFPQFQAVPNEDQKQVTAISKSLKEQIKNAEDAEYIRNDYLTAASIYQNAFVRSENNSVKARMLNHKARNLMKATRYRNAVNVYTEIIEAFPGIRTISGVPLDLYAKIQKAECYVLMGDKVSAARCDLNVFEELIENRWELNESQFHTYSSIVLDRLVGFMHGNDDKLNAYNSQFESLHQRFQFRIVQLQVIGNIRSFIIPELTGYFQTNSQSNLPNQLSDRIGNEDYLILAAWIPEQGKAENAGILGVKIDNRYLQNNILKNAADKILPRQNTALSITSLAGDSISGDKNYPPDAITTTVLFENNFPPWRLELAYIGPGNLGELSIFANFFFWTIITLIVILVFGTVLVTRIVAHEMEILKIKSDFVSSVSHEFKTPLTSMKSLTERLEKGKVVQPAKVKKYVSILSSDIDKLIRLVNNILNFSKIEEGKKVYHMERTAVSTWLEEVIHNYKKGCIERDVAMNFHLQIEEGVPDLDMDRDAMRQVLFNLLDNAVKFSGDNKKVEVSVYNVNHSVIIQVKDLGVGIDDDEKEKVFEKFYRGNSAVVHSIKGTGLGLAMVKHIVEAHNGQIQVKQDPGWSTVFEIRLPITDYK